MDQQEVNKFFRWKCFLGLKRRGFADNQVYIDRLNYELDVIEKMGFPSYFLIVCDFIGWARTNNVLVGPGRGSAAGSLAAWCLGITALDPIKYDLYFERFLNPSRISMPDCDVDFQDDKRDLVIKYVKQHYGSDRVSGIGTYGTLACRGAIRVVARTLGVDYEIGDKISKLTPPPINGVPPKVAKCITDVPELANMYARSGVEHDILDWAKKIEGRVDHSGSHASGILIGDRPLNKLVPLTLDKKDRVVSQWDMNEVEKIGLVKFDFLGLAALTVIGKALELIKKRHDITIDINNIPVDDEATYRHLQGGDTAGIFQVETSAGIRELMIKMQPKNLDDLGSLVAAYRPGPLASEEFQTWLKVRAGQEKAHYLVPELEHILSKTDGFMILQEQTMRIAVDLAGYTLAESDSLRKAIGKKLPEEMAKHESKFKNGMVNKGFDSKVADKIWNDIKAFAAYGFNAAHSYCYGFITYQTAYLKTHYPVEYMCAALTCKQGDTDQMIKYIFNCHDIGIKVLPPDINESDIQFTIDSNNNIRFGLAAIKNLGEDIVGSIVEARKAGQFKSILDFIDRVNTSKLNKTKLESLVLSGALDYTGHTRASMMDVIEQTLEFKKLMKAYQSKVETYNKKHEQYEARNEEIKLAEIAGKKTRLKPLKCPVYPEQPKNPIIKTLPEFSEKELLSNEKELLGFYISGHPVDKYKPLISADQALQTIEEIKEDPAQVVHLIAIPSSIDERTAKKTGQKMASVVLEDHTGSIGCTVFSKSWAQWKGLLESKEPLRFKCKCNIVEAQDGSTSVELAVISIGTLQHVSIAQNQINLELELDLNKMKAIRGLITKFAGNETRVRLTFKGKHNAIVPLEQTFTIRGQDLFLREFNGLNN